MSGHCKDCRFWDGQHSLGHYETNRVMYQCQNHTVTKEMSDLLYTHESFGCIQFEPKSQNVPTLESEEKR